MNLAQALKRVGAEIVKQEKRSDGGYTLMLRIDKERASLWNDTLTEFILASSDGRVTWAQDVSKFFYAHKESGTVRYLWRVMLLKDGAAAAEALGRAATRAIAAGVEVKTFPLVGRRTYPVDPANGKIAGAHDPRTAAGLLAAARGGQ